MFVNGCANSCRVAKLLYYCRCAIIQKILKKDGKMKNKAKDTIMNKEKCEELICLLAKRTGTDGKDWYLTFRAREAMQVVFEEVKKLRGAGSVMLQPFTCSTVPEAVIASGMDLDMRTSCRSNLSMDRKVMNGVASRIMSCSYPAAHIRHDRR